ncbi:hypothetical protein [Stenotrophomonas phage CM2]
MLLALFHPDLSGMLGFLRSLNCCTIFVVASGQVSQFSILSLFSIAPGRTLPRNTLIDVAQTSTSVAAEQLSEAG